MPKKVNIDRTVLEQLYVAEGKSPSEIAGALGCSKATVSNYINRYGISRSAHGETGTAPVCEEKLRAAYVYEGKHISELAAMFGCSVSTISSYLKKWKLKDARNDFLDSRICELVAKDRSYRQIANELGIGREQVAQRAKAMGVTSERQDARDAFDEDEATRMYVEDKKSLNDIATWFHVSKSMVRDTLVRHEVALRSQRCATERRARCRQVRDECPIARLDEQVRSNWGQWFDSLGILYECDAHPLEGVASISFYLPEFQAGIDFAHTADRSIDMVRDDEGSSTLQVDTRYHQRQSVTLDHAGIRLVRIYDWSDEDKMYDIVQGICMRNRKIPARKTHIISISYADEKAFLAENHLQGYVHSEICYGLIDDEGDLVAVMSFCRPRYGNKDNADWELLRFCSSSGITVVGGASKLFRHFIRIYRPAKVMSYCNYDISNGTMYEALGFSYERITNPSYIWVNLKDQSEHYSWNLVNAMGYDKLFGTSYGKGTSNTDLLLQHGFVRVYNAGNKVYTWVGNTKI